MTDNFAEIEKTIKSDPESYPETQLLSITVDPDYDTPSVLSEYAATHAEGSDHWDFATGSKEEIKQFATYFGIQYWPAGNEVVHSLRTAIVDADGRLVKLYRGNEWRPDEVLSEVKNLKVRG
jgi:protein SCO1/2